MIKQYSLNRHKVSKLVDAIDELKKDLPTN